MTHEAAMKEAYQLGRNAGPSGLGDLSGEWADDWTPVTLAIELGFDAWTMSEWDWNTMCDAFERGAADSELEVT